ncbi:HpcH/HpaI aldolase family protein [Allopusillimonas ginsengisoli]|uniref:HpcH/HpaI aldolase family protein n=1 Tax=Allopusillimonas ginsengisoli TaxID=453575 RepID=UPI0010C16E0A|nr:2-dehydro-3-deoxyglucarate aldolase [Allopusillimonas ginsengisoli]
MSTSNAFKIALASHQQQYGLWCSLASNVTAEVVAGAGFDWLLIDVEHSPNDLRSVLSQLQAVAAYPVEPIVRPPCADVVLIKQYLDIGVRSLLLPNIESAEQARAMVAATRYAMQGMRGVSVSSRANNYGRVTGYHQQAHDNICLVLQIESPQAVSQAQAIAEVDGVDALFVGPSDLSASMGLLLQPRRSEVQAAIAAVRDSAEKAGKPVGILAPDAEDARRYLEMGYTMVGLGSDLGLLARSADTLAQRFKAPPTD